MTVPCRSSAWANAIVPPSGETAGSLSAPEAVSRRWPDPSNCTVATYVGPGRASDPTSNSVKASRSPVGNQLGASAKCWCGTGWRPEPSGATSQSRGSNRSGPPGATRTTARRWPSGDHAGWLAPRSTRRRPLPSAFTTQSQPPCSYASRWPSGDHAGSRAGA